MAVPTLIYKIFKQIFINSEAIHIIVHDSYTTGEIRTTEKYHIQETTSYNS
jgi:hypothetical protein